MQKYVAMRVIFALHHLVMSLIIFISFIQHGKFPTLCFSLNRISFQIKISIYGLYVRIATNIFMRKEIGKKVQ